MKTQNHSNKHGGALLMAMLVMLAFSILAIGLFKLFQTDAVESVYVEQHRRAFWMAETGLERVMDRLALDQPFRNNPDLSVPYTVVDNAGAHSNTSYKIASITTSSVGATGSVYTVTVVGYAGTMNRRIQQTVLVRPGGPNALRATGGDIVIDSNVHIDGDVFVDEGDVTINAKENLSSQNPTGVDGYLIVSVGSVSGRGASRVDVIESPPPPQPSIDMTFWQPFLDGVTLDPNPNTNGLVDVDAIYITTGVSNYNYSATNSTMTTGKDLIIDGTASGTNGFHYLVSVTSIDFNHRSVVKDQTIIIVVGDVNFAQNVTFHNNCIVFATGDIYVEQSSDASGIGATLIAQGDVTFGQNMTFHGIIYAEGTVNVGQNSKIKGTIIADDGINIDSNAEITFDPNVFLNPLPGLNNVTAESNFTPLVWKEIAPE